jgi:membrane protein
VENLNGAVAAPIAVVGALWLASGALHTVMSAFERFADIPLHSWWQKRLIALVSVGALLSALLVSGTITLSLIGGVDALLSLSRGGDHEAAREARDALGLATWIGFLVAVVTLTGLVAAFFRVGLPSRGPRRSIWPGAMVAVGLGAIGSTIFVVYLKTIARHSVYYGSLAAVAITMIWLFVMSLALLLGAETNLRLDGHSRSPGQV